MAWPPPVLPINRTNALPMQDTHPQDHNAVNLAVNDTVAFLQRRVGFIGALSGFSMPPSVDTFLSWTQTVLDDPVGHLTAANTVTIKDAGQYLVQVRWRWTGTVGSGIIPGLWFSGSKYADAINGATSGMFMATIGLAAGNTISASLYSSNPSAITVSADLTVLRWHL
jgi:hypothetical protein